MSKIIGILTSGGDCPGLNAAIRAVGKAGIEVFGMSLIGFRDGFRGLMQDRYVTLDGDSLSNILTQGGTILGTSRDKPHRMPVGNRVLDMTDAMVEVVSNHQLEAIICLGGGGTQKNALRLLRKGIPVVTLPKTIDNDVGETDASFGFDTALAIATDAVDRLHSTATSHNRVIVVEIMGHRAGWLALGAGLAGGADAILIPEIPYDIEVVADSIRRRTRRGKRFSIVAVAEGAMTHETTSQFAALKAQKEACANRKEREAVRQRMVELDHEHIGNTLRLTTELELRTGLESRLTILGHLQRGGTPSASDRVLATMLGTKACELVAGGESGFMVAAKNGMAVPVPLEAVAGQRKTVPLDHPWMRSARQLGVCFGD